MNHNFSAGRLRHYVQLFGSDLTRNENGEVVEGAVFVFDARADVQVKSGTELIKFGTVVTSSIITVLMRYDDRMVSDLFLRWNNVSYRVIHIQPDPLLSSMVVACELVTDDDPIGLSNVSYSDEYSGEYA